MCQFLDLLWARLDSVIKVSLNDTIQTDSLTHVLFSQSLTPGEITLCLVIEEDI